MEEIDMFLLIIIKNLGLSLYKQSIKVIVKNIINLGFFIIELMNGVIFYKEMYLFRKILKVYRLFICKFFFCFIYFR